MPNHLSVLTNYCLESLNNWSHLVSILSAPNNLYIKQHWTWNYRYDCGTSLSPLITHRYPLLTGKTSAVWCGTVIQNTRTNKRKSHQKNTTFRPSGIGVLPHYRTIRTQFIYTVQSADPVCGVCDGKRMFTANRHFYEGRYFDSSGVTGRHGHILHPTDSYHTSKNELTEWHTNRYTEWLIDYQTDWLTHLLTYHSDSSPDQSMHRATCNSKYINTIIITDYCPYPFRNSKIWGATWGVDRSLMRTEYPIL